jgi:predicted nucleotidyltransferase
MNSLIQLDMPAVREICERYGVQELRLFGSALGPDFGADSDLDLLVEFRPSVQFGLIELLRLRDELQDALGRAVDLVPRNGLKPSIRESVLAKTELLYAA